MLAAALAVAAPAEDLNARLLAATSATAVLEQWCAEHRLADPPRVRAERSRRVRPASAAVRADLGVGPAEPVRYRRVQLKCGKVLMSEAENWYVPGRLTPEMNAMLDGGDTPFGTAIRPLAPHRHTLSVTWTPDGHGFHHRALVLDREGRVLAEVVETYARVPVGGAD